MTPSSSGPDSRQQSQHSAEYFLHLCSPTRNHLWQPSFLARARYVCSHFRGPCGGQDSILGRVHRPSSATGMAHADAIHPGRKLVIAHLDASRASAIQAAGCCSLMLLAGPGGDCFCSGTSGIGLIGIPLRCQRCALQGCCSRYPMAAPLTISWDILPLFIAHRPIPQQDWRTAAMSRLRLLISQQYEGPECSGQLEGVHVGWTFDISSLLTFLGCIATVVYVLCVRSVCTQELPCRAMH